MPRRTDFSNGMALPVLHRVEKQPKVVRVVSIVETMVQMLKIVAVADRAKAVAMVKTPVTSRIRNHLAGAMSARKRQSYRMITGKVNRRKNNRVSKIIEIEMTKIVAMTQIMRKKLARNKRIPWPTAVVAVLVMHQNHVNF